MNKKGFTLIEVIMVIALIGILSMMIAPNVVLIINKNKEKSCKSLIGSIESACEIYVSNHRYELNLGSCNNNEKISISIPLRTLVESGDLTEPIVNPLNNEKINIDTNKVNVDFNCDNKTFTYKFDGIICSSNE